MDSSFWNANVDPSSSHLVTLAVVPQFLDPAQFEAKIKEGMSEWSRCGISRLELMLAPASHALLIPSLISIGEKLKFSNFLFSSYIEFAILTESLTLSSFNFISLSLRIFFLTCQRHGSRSL